jgi:hypothetical protein
VLRPIDHLSRVLMRIGVTSFLEGDYISSSGLRPPAGPQSKTEIYIMAVLTSLWQPVRFSSMSLFRGTAETTLYFVRSFNSPLHFQGQTGRSSIARVERAHSYRARSASTGEQQATLPFFFSFPPTSPSPDCPLLRASNEGLLRPRVARARRMVWPLPSHSSFDRPPPSRL